MSKKKQTKRTAKKPPEKTAKNNTSVKSSGTQAKKTAAHTAPPAKPAKPKKKESAVKKIYVTTDGYFNNRSDIKKSRLIAVIEQRKDDGALAVVKIYSEDGKEQKIGKTFIPGLVLTPENHPALTQNSIIGRQVTIGVKRINQDKPICLYPDDFCETGDALTNKEYKKVKKEVHNDDPKHRKTFKEKIKKWLKHFKQ